MSVFAALGGVVKAESAAPSATLQAGDICRAPDVESIRKNSLLQIVTPSLQDPSLAATLDQALTGTPAVCAYTNELIPALQRATSKLASDHLYVFNLFPTLTAAHLEWKKNWEVAACANDVTQPSLKNEKCYVPKLGKIHEALESLYGPFYSSECASGLQIGEYETLNELFGRKIENYFSRQEIFVGDWSAVNTSASVIPTMDQDSDASLVVKPKNSLRLIYDWDYGVSYANLGAHALIGVPGFIGASFSNDFVDDKVDRNENFVIVNTTESAAQALAQKLRIVKSSQPGGRDRRLSGLFLYTMDLRQVWELAQTADPEDLTKLLQLEDWGVLGKVLNPESNEAHQVSGKEPVEIVKILMDPFLEQTQVYVHPVGKKSITWHILRLLTLNPRTPYQINFYPESTHGEIFQRWLRFQLDQCDN